MLCLKRQFTGLRYGLYITVQLLRVVGDSSIDSELPFCAKGGLPARALSVRHLYPHRSLLAAEISLPRAMPGSAGPSTPPPSARQMRFLCSSLLVCGRDDLLSRYKSYSNILSCRASEPSRAPSSANFFPAFRPSALLAASRRAFLPRLLVYPISLSPCSAVPA